MGVLMQAFYWDCPRLENQEFAWWNYVAVKVPSLRQVGFTALWLPPPCKAANLGGPSMGYDPYDYYDLGTINQKGSQKTWFGSEDELRNLISVAHTHGLQVYADVVFNHNSGGDAAEVNPVDNVSRWTRFEPGSGKFPRDYKCFHPSPYETWDGGTFADMPDVCHRNPYVYEQLIEYARHLLEDVGFDGFRYDCVKGYGGWMTRAIQELRALRGGKPFKPFGVGECWDSDRVITEWLDETNAWSDNPVSAFDFPLRDRLKGLADSYGYSLANLAAPGTLHYDRPSLAVTFVENHDVARSNPIINGKMMAYAYILTHEGYPSVFWQDYYDWQLGREGSADGIAALVGVHEQYAGGVSSVLYLDDVLYVMQRSGFGTQPGLVLVINNLGDRWNGRAVKTQWADTKLTPAAWGGQDQGTPQEKWTDAQGWTDLWAPPRGYAVYVPQA